MPFTETLKEKINQFRYSSNTTLALVTLLLLVDYMLLFAVVPVVPVALWHEELRYVKSTNYSEWRLENGTLPNLTKAFVHHKEKEYLATQSLKIGILLSSKPLVQMTTNFIVGPLVDKIGYPIPLCVGCVVLVVTSIIFALGKVYGVLLAAVAIQGIGSSCAMSAGMTLVALKYTDEAERSQAISYALSAIGIGLLFGSPYGSVVSTFAGKTTAFLILAGIVVILGLFFLFIMSSHEVLTESESVGERSSVLKLYMDPYIFLCAGGIFWTNAVISAATAAFPTWLILRFNTPPWAIGLVLMPATVSYAVTANIFGCFSTQIPRHIASSAGLIILSIGMICVPFSSSFVATIGPTIVMGIGAGTLETNIFPVLGKLVDLRHGSSYGSVYSLADISLCAAFFAGPLTTGALLKVISFPWIARIIGIMVIVWSPLMLLIKKPLGSKENEEEMHLLEESSVNKE